MTRSLRLAPKLILFYVLFAALLLTSVGALAAFSGRNALEAATVFSLESTATEKQAALTSWLAERQDDIDIITKTSNLTQHLADFVSAKPDSPEAQAAHDSVVAALYPQSGVERQFLELSILEPQFGRIIAATDSSEEGKFRESHAAFINGKTALYIEGPFYPLQLQTPTMTISAPLRSTEGELLGILIGRMNLSQMTPIIQRRSAVQQTEDAFLVNAAGLFITQPRFISDPVVLQQGVHMVAVQPCLAGNSGEVLAEDYRGIPAIVVYRWLSERRMCLIVKLDQAEAFAPSNTFSRTILFVSVLVFGVALLLAIGLARTITRPVLALQAGVAGFGRGDLDIRLPETSSDELGLLAREFNTMAASLVERAKQLRQSEAKFSTAFRVGPAAMSIATISDGRWIEINDALAKMTGYSKEELIGHTSAELGIVDGAGRARILEAIRVQGKVRDVEIQVRTKSQEFIVVLVSVEQIEINGQACVLTIHNDITALKRAQAALQTSEERYRSLFDNAPIGISIGQGPIRTYVNPAFVHMFGYEDSAEISGRSSLDQIAPQSRPEIIERFSQEPPPLGQAEAFESFGQKKDGTIFPVQVQLARLELATGISRVIFVSDISVRKRAEAALRQSEQKLQTFFEMLPVGISVMDSTGQIIEMNPALARIMGMSKEGLASGADKSRLVIRGDGTPLLPPDFPSARALAEQQPIYDMEIGVIKEDETVIWTSVSATPLPLPNSGAIVVTLDITERKRAESRFQALLEFGPDAIVIVNPEGNIVLVNSQTETLFGYARQELVGQPVERLIPERFHSRHPAHRDTYIAAPLMRGMGVGLELHALRKDGSEFPIEISLSPIETAAGVLVASSIRDVSERKKIQDALAQLAAIVESSGDAIISKSLDGTIVSWNMGAKRIFGYDADEMIGKPIDMLFPPEKIDDESIIIESLLQGNVVDEFETERMTKDGRHIPVALTISPMKNANGKIIGASKIIRDITVRKQAEAALRKSEALLAEMGKLGRIGGWEVDLETSEIMWTEQVFRIHEVEPMNTPTVGEIFEFYAPASRPQIEQALQRASEHGEPYDLELEIITAKGTPRWIHTIGKAHQEQGKPKTVSGMIQDITERKQIEVQLAAQAKELARSNQELEQFAYIASHDLQEPLRMVTSYMGLLSRRYQGKLDGKADTYIGFAVDGATRMQQLINDLLAYSRVGNRELDFSSLDTEKVLKTVLLNLGVAVKESGAQITHDALPTLQADKNQLAQLFQNLIGNAIKFHGEDAPQVHISAHQQDSQWLFSIRDNGIGVASEYTEQIFEIFKRLHTRKHYSGTGLGLAICKKIVERHSGRIWLDSEPGKGSTFYFSLPIKDDKS